jgi:flagellar biosynthesis/type III secretory pathway M-ring protein FliF/YscJ
MIGLLLGISLVLATWLGVMVYRHTPAILPTLSVEDENKGAITTSPPPRSEHLSYAEQIQLKQQIEQALELKTQSLLDDIIGVERSKVRIHTTLTFSREETQTQTLSPGQNGTVLAAEINEKTDSSQMPQSPVQNLGNRRIVQNVTDPLVKIQRLNIALSIDDTKVVYNPDTETYDVENRRPEEYEKLGQLARQAAGFNTHRGDQIAVKAFTFDKTQHIVDRLSAEQAERKQILINIAVVVGIFWLFFFCAGF